MSDQEVLEYLETHLGSLGVTTKHPILQKCVELCRNHRMDPEDFIDEWLAFSASKLNGAGPTMETLDQMDRKVLKNHHLNISKPPPTPMGVKTPVGTPIRVPEVSVPVIHEEAAVPSVDFAKRNDAGSVIEVYGISNPKTFKERYKSGLFIKLGNKVTTQQYMYEKFQLKQTALTEIYRTVISDILQHTNLELTRDKLTRFSDSMVICGRILPDTAGKMEESSIQLEGFIDIYRGQRIKLSVKKLKEVALFSGQAVVIRGNNMVDWFTVSEIWSGVPLPPPEQPLQLSEPLQLMVAAGPFTVPTNLLCEPLDSLLTYASESKPNILILMGPFLDRAHPLVKDMSECYDTFFENMVDGIMQRLAGRGIQVILVPSHKDIHNHIVFPSLPYKLKKRYEGLHLVPNPFILDIDGFVIGGATADVLFHLGKAEYCSGMYGERISRLISHLFNQRSFYPLYPPDSEIRVDYSLLEQMGMILHRPDLMILPSNFKSFMKTVEKCVVVNPERLTKGNSGGTFARIEVRPMNSREDVGNSVSCQICRV